MATVQQGAMAILFGVPDLGTVTLGGQSIASAIVVSEIGLTPTAQEIRSMDENGNTVNITTFDPGMEVTLTCKPRGTTAANAATANGYFPAIGTVCTILQAASGTVRFEDNGYSKATAADYTNGWSYRVKSASKNMSAGQQVTWNLTLERLDSIKSMTALS